VALQAGGRGGDASASLQPRPGRAVQVNPIKSTLKAPGTKRLKLNYNELLSNFAFNFNLRHDTPVQGDYYLNFKLQDCTDRQICRDMSGITTLAGRCRMAVSEICVESACGFSA